MLGDKGEKIQITLCIAHHTVEIVDLKQAQITMIILVTFLLKLSALFGGELVGFAFPRRTSCPPLMIFQKRLAIVRPPTIRPPGQFHLQYAKVDPELQFLATIQARNLAYLNIAVLVRPILQDGIEVQTHRN